MRMTFPIVTRRLAAVPLLTAKSSALLVQSSWTRIFVLERQTFAPPAERLASLSHQEWISLDDVQVSVELT